MMCLCFFFNDTATTVIYTYVHTLSLHDALPICAEAVVIAPGEKRRIAHGDLHARFPTNWRSESPWMNAATNRRSEEHTSELQSLMRISYAVLCLKKKTINKTTYSVFTIIYYYTSQQQPPNKFFTLINPS